MAGASPFSGVPVEPDLLEHVLQSLAEVPVRRRKRESVLVVCARAYAEWIGIEAEPGVDAMDGGDIDTIAAVAARLHALADLLQAGHYKADMTDDTQRAVVVAAACSATLVGSERGSSFQLLDFLAAVDRAKAGIG